MAKEKYPTRGKRTRPEGWDLHHVFGRSFKNGKTKKLATHPLMIIPGPRRQHIDLHRDPDIYAKKLERPTEAEAILCLSALDHAFKTAHPKPDADLKDQDYWEKVRAARLGAVMETARFFGKLSLDTSSESQRQQGIASNLTTQLTYLSMDTPYGVDLGNEDELSTIISSEPIDMGALRQVIGPESMASLMECYSLDPPANTGKGILAVRSLAGVR